MKLLHTSDWHLGMTFRNGVSYERDQRFAINNICKIAVEEKVDGILLAGDVFDKSIASREAILLYDEMMTYICGTLNIPIYMVAGNHDGAERIAQCNELLKKSGLHIAGALKKEPQVVNVDDVDIYLLPWISTDKVAAIYPEEAENISSMEDAYRIVLDKYRETFVEGHKHIIVAHAFIANAETSVSDRAAELGHATMVGSYVFDGFDYVALGHLHGPQKINENIRYSGTPMTYSFGKEEKQEKSVTIIDTDTGEKKEIVIPQLHKRITLTGTFDELMAADYDKDILEGYVRLEITDKYAGVEAMASFRERYANLLEITSKSFEAEDARITMTIEELEQANLSPETVFQKYYQDTYSEALPEHRLKLFENAIKEYEKEAVEK